MFRIVLRLRWFVKMGMLRRTAHTATVCFRTLHGLDHADIGPIWSSLGAGNGPGGFVQTEKVVMTYRGYCGASQSPTPGPLERSRLPFREFNSLDDALGWAHRIRQHGSVAFLIEGDDGTRLFKTDIASALAHGERELQ